MRSISSELLTVKKLESSHWQHIKRACPGCFGHYWYLTTLISPLMSWLLSCAQKAVSKNLLSASTRLRETMLFETTLRSISNGHLFASKACVCVFGPRICYVMTLFIMSTQNKSLVISWSWFWWRVWDGLPSSGANDQLLPPCKIQSIVVDAQSPSFLVPVRRSGPSPEDSVSRISCTIAGISTMTTDAKYAEPFWYEWNVTVQLGIMESVLISPVISVWTRLRISNFRWSVEKCVYDIDISILLKDVSPARR